MALLHYREIATATDLPFFPYQFGEHGNVGGIPAFIDRLLTIPNVEGMKLTTNNLLEISTYAYNSKGRLTLFSGSDELMCQAALCGTVGAIGSTYNLWGKECQKVRAAFLEGDVQLGADFMLVFQEVIGSILPSFWSFVRQAMLLRYNIDVGMPIAPLGNTNVIWAENRVIDLVERVTNAADLKILQPYE
jgi:N-acetylneuraminate lyase